MTSSLPLDPELLPLVELLAIGELSEATLPRVRRRVTEMGGDARIPDGLDVTLEERTISGGDGNQIPLLIFRPLVNHALLPIVLHIHGGGFVMGSPRLAITANSILAAAAKALVVSVEYRLAPETPFPGAIEDCYAALCWLNLAAPELGADRTRFAVMGESAGGGLAASLALMARDRGEVAITHQHLIYPMLDDRTCTAADPHPHTGAFVWTQEANRFGWSALLGEQPGAGSAGPYAAAARAEDLTGLPSAFIAAGALDLFVEENIDYAKRLMRAGVPTELHVYPAACHAFDLSPTAAVARSARRASLDALKMALHPHGGAKYRE